MNKSRIRAVSWIVLVVFSLVIFCSSAFIIIHADHECTGVDCSVCMEIAQCQNTLRTLATAAAGMPKFIPALCAAASLCCIVIKHLSEHTTLISLKVELLN